MTLKRLDIGNLPKMTRDKDGFLVGDAYVTRTGIFDYYNEDGSKRRELRHPDDVFTKEFFESLKMIPITFLHPNENNPDETDVTPENAKLLSVGFTGEQNGVEGKYVKLRLKITDGQTITRIEGGEAMELSLGYSCEVIEEKGVYNNDEYDMRQTNITHNHLSVVPIGRAGSNARINLDSMGNQKLTMVNKNQTEENTMPEGLIKVHLDGLSYDAAPEISKHIEKLSSKVDSAEKLNGELQAKLDAEKKEKDSLQAKVDASEKEKEDNEKNYDKKVKDAAKALMDAMKKAQDMLGEEKEDSDEEEMEKKGDAISIKKFAIEKKVDGIDLSKKSDDYVNAYFDSLYAQHLDSVADSNADDMEAGYQRHDAGGNANRSDADKAYEKMKAEKRNRHMHGFKSE